MKRLVLLLALLLPRHAGAKASTELGYHLDEVFSTSLRYLRVNRGCKITDKDPDAAFVIFECKADGDHVSRGSLEIFHAKREGHDTVRVEVTLPDEGHGPEIRLLELLERKLREERGSPPPPAKPAPPPMPPDAGVKEPF